MDSGSAQTLRTTVISNAKEEQPLPILSSLGILCTFRASQEACGNWTQTVGNWGLPWVWAYLDGWYISQLGCHSKTPQTGGLNNKNLFLTVPEAVSPRSMCQQIWFLQRPFSLACKRPHSCWIPKRALPRCVHTPVSSLLTRMSVLLN